MTNPNENPSQPATPNDPLESLLQQCALSQPSPALDFRIHSLIASAPSKSASTRHRILIPLLSFAAGILLTCAILVPFKFAQATPTTPAAPTTSTTSTTPTTPTTPALANAAPAAPTPVEVVAQPHQSTEELSATLNGIPIQLQTTRTQFITYPANAPATHISLSDTVTISQARQF